MVTKKDGASTVGYWIAFFAVWALLFSATYVYGGAVSFAQQHYWEHRQADKGRAGIEGTAEVTHVREEERRSGFRTWTNVTCRAGFAPDDGGAEVTVTLYLPGECEEGAVYEDARMVPATESRWDPADTDEAHVPGGGTGGKSWLAFLATLGQFLLSGFGAMVLVDWVYRRVTSVRNRIASRGFPSR